MILGLLRGGGMNFGLRSHDGELVVEDRETAGASRLVFIYWYEYLDTEAYFVFLPCFVVFSRSATTVVAQARAHRAFVLFRVFRFVFSRLPLMPPITTD